MGCVRGFWPATRNRLSEAGVASFDGDDGFSNALPLAGWASLCSRVVAPKVAPRARSASRRERSALFGVPPDAG